MRVYSRGCGGLRGRLVLRENHRRTEGPRMLQSATPVLSCVQVPEVLPVVMPDVPAVPAMLPAVPAQLTLPASLPADLPAEGRAALASALAGPVPGRPAERGDLVQAGAGACWDGEGWAWR